MIVLILEFRARLLRVLQKYQLVLIPLVKFILTFVCFHTINKAIGREPHLTKTVTELGLSVLGTFCPAVLIVLLCALVSLAHIYVASPILAILVAILMLVLYFFIARFSGKYGYVVLVTPILFILKIPYVVPLLLGLIATPLSVIPMACGVITYRMFVIIKAAADMDLNLGINDILALYIDVIDKLLADRQTIITIAVFSVIVIVMCLIRKLHVDYVFEISVVAGTVLGILGFLFGDMFLETQMDITGMVLGMVVGMLLTLLFSFLRFVLDYSAVERVQFEDDDYYYYVKAVPKIKLTIPNRRTKKISVAEKPDGEELSGNEDFSEGEEDFPEDDEDGMFEDPDTGEVFPEGNIRIPAEKLNDEEETEDSDVV